MLLGRTSMVSLQGLTVNQIAAKMPEVFLHADDDIARLVSSKVG